MTLELAEENNVRLLTVNNFTVSVLVEGKEVALYGIEHSGDGKAVTCWVESESGKSFGVQWKGPKCTSDTSGYLFVDGIQCGGVINYAGSQDICSKIDYCNTGSTRRKLVFSDIETTDDDAYYGQAIPEEFGSIKLLIRRVEVINRFGKGDKSEKRALEKVHERSKKAMRHQVKLGEEVPAQKNWVDVNYVEVLATFIIRYRPKEYLQANDIIPRSKKRKADPGDIIDLTLNNVEDSEDDDEIRELQARIRTIKKNKQKSNKRVKEEVKHETIEL